MNLRQAAEYPVAIATTDGDACRMPGHCGVRGLPPP